MVKSRSIEQCRFLDNAPLRLFCLPCAGGSGVTYQHWQASLPLSIAVCPITYPGRGARLSKSPLGTFAELLRVIADEIDSELDRPYAFFGHSMGALLAFEYTRLRANNCKRLPEMLFVAGARPPHIQRDSSIHHLPDDELIGKLREMNGTPRELLDDLEAMSLFLPAIRGDFSAVETYTYKDQNPLPCPMSIFHGAADHSVSLEQAGEWARHTVAHSSVTVFSGDHFFPMQYSKDVTRTVRTILTPITAVLDGSFAQMV